MMYDFKCPKCKKMRSHRNSIGIKHLGRLVCPDCARTIKKLRRRAR